MEESISLIQNGVELDSRIVSGSSDGKVILWNPLDYNKSEVIGIDNKIITKVISWSSLDAIVSSSHEAINIWYINNPLMKMTLTIPVVTIALWEEKELIFFSSRDKTLRVWNIKNNSTNTLSTVNSIITMMTIWKERNLIIYCTENSTLESYDIEKGKSTVIARDANYIGSIAIWNRKNLIITALRNGYIIAWSDIQDGTNTIIIGKHEMAAIVVIIWDRENLIVSGSVDQTIRIWDIDDPSKNKIVGRHDIGTVISLAILEKENLIVSAARDNKIRVWDRVTPFYNITRPGRNKVISKYDCDINSINIVDPSPLKRKAVWCALLEHLGEYIDEVNVIRMVNQCF